MILPFHHNVLHFWIAGSRHPTSFESPNMLFSLRLLTFLLLSRCCLAGPIIAFLVEVTLMAADAGIGLAAEAGLDMAGIEAADFEETLGTIFSGRLGQAFGYACRDAYFCEEVMVVNNLKYYGSGYAGVGVLGGAGIGGK